MTASERATRWAEAGYVPAVDVLSSDEVGAVRERFDALEREVGRDTAEIKLQNRHLDLAFVWRVATHPRVLDAVESVVGPDLLLMSSHFFCKYPADERGERFVAWHQDLTYWGLEPARAVSAWMAIDDADVDNGCMHVVPGSHRRGIVEHGQSAREGNLLSVNQEVPAERVDEDRAVPVPLRAGQVSLHDGMLLHASWPNRSRRRRCGLAVRFTTPDVRQTQKNSLGRYWSAVLVRGQDRFGHWPPVEVSWAPGEGPATG